MTQRAQAHEKKLKIPSHAIIQSKLERGILLFLKQETQLFEAMAGERLLTGRLALALRVVFADWDVDAEYNRFGQRSKRSLISSRRKTRNARGHLVTPDIIVHKRLRPTGQNLLAVEAKHDGKEKGSAKDREKLASYLGWPLCYEYVALMAFSASTRPWCSFELFSSGENPEQPKERVEIILESKAHQCGAKF